MLLVVLLYFTNTTGTVLVLVDSVIENRAGDVGVVSLLVVVVVVGVLLDGWMGYFFLFVSTGGGG